MDTERVGHTYWYRDRRPGTPRWYAFGAMLSEIAETCTDKAVSMAVIDICRFENGKLVEHWGSALACWHRGIHCSAER